MIKEMLALTFCPMLFAVCLPVEAQQTGKVYRVGFPSGGFPGPTHWTSKIRGELQRIGYAIWRVTCWHERIG